MNAGAPEPRAKGIALLIEVDVIRRAPSITQAFSWIVDVALWAAAPILVVSLVVAATVNLFRPIAERMGWSVETAPIHMAVAMLAVLGLIARATLPLKKPEWR